MRRTVIQSTACIAFVWLSFAQDARAQRCSEQTISQHNQLVKELNATVEQTNAKVRELKRTADCSLVAAILAAESQMSGMCTQIKSQYGHCGAKCDWSRNAEAAQQFAKEIQGYCKSAPAAVPPTTKSASCSDITGTTSSKSAAASDCRSADTALKAARATRTQNPKRATENFKKAAEAYRQAGDTVLAEAVLREAGLLIAAAPQPPAQVTGASRDPGAQQLPGGLRPIWTGREPCHDASEMEKNTAGWYETCMRPKQTKYKENPHTPSIDPQILFQRARERCRTASVEAMRRCIMEAKVAILLAEDLAIRSECGATTGDARIVCVHGAYLYGPSGSDRAEREERKRNELIERHKEYEKRISAMPGSVETPSTYSVPLPRLCSKNCCPPGTGMKPTPGAFGAWSCQPLGIIYLARDRPTGAPDPVEAFERRIVEIAASAVLAVANAAGAQLSAADRDMCQLAALAAVHSVLKGGAPPVPGQCRPMADAARSELAYYAAARIDTRSNPAAEELLSALAESGLRAPSTAPSISTSPAKTTAQPTVPPPAAPTEECRRLREFIANTPGIMTGATGETLSFELRSKGCGVP